MGWWKVVLLMVVLLVCPSTWAQDPSGQTPSGEDEQVRVKGDTLTYEDQSNVVSATGNVVVTKGQTTLSADTISVNRDTNTLDARGHVELKDSLGQIEAETLQMEMENETGTLTNGIVTLPRSQYVLTGKELKKSYGQTYHIEDGVFTTCDCDKNFKKADWSIGASTIDVALRGMGTIRHGVLRVRGLPLLYVPYAFVPVRTDRQSGFLFPNYGFSSKRGFVWQQPFYWAINKSYDATVTTDLETAARIGAWGEFRYAPNERTEGLLAASYFNEQIRGPATTTGPINRWSVTGVHRQLLAQDFRAYGDFFFVSDDQFLREISHRALNLKSALELDDWDLRTRRFTDSRAGGVKTWRNALLRGEARYYQDLRLDDDFAFQTLPRVQFRTQHAWKDHVELGLSVDGANFYRNKGYAGQRLDIAPSVALPFHLGKYLYGSLKATGRETVYHMTSEDQGCPPPTKSGQLRGDRTSKDLGCPTLPESGQLRGDRTRETVQFRAELGTRLSRVFNLNWGRLRQLQHVIEPQVSYSYVPAVHQQQDLPLYDSLDRINRRNLFVYGFSSRVLGKFATTPEAGATDKPSAPTTEVRELARFSVTHAYDPSRAIGRKKEHFSDVDITARLSPLPYTTFTVDSTYDVARGDVTMARLGASLSDPRPLPATAPLLADLQRRTTLGVSYRTVTDRILKEMNVYAVLRLNEYVTGAYFGRYDFNAGSFIGNRYYLRFISPQNCWYVDLGLIDKVNPKELEFRFLITFVGLSSSSRSAF
ncbi:MAG: LPS-assembly protein LptD [Deltaproteobacteria bacterium]|nr:LPS-assembly protein LptD [Deltaproteobacteria bacterium]